MRLIIDEGINSGRGIKADRLEGSETIRKRGRGGGKKGESKQLGGEFISGVLLITKGEGGCLIREVLGEVPFTYGHVSRRVGRLARWLTIALTRRHRKAPSISSSPLVNPPSFQHLLR